MNLATAESPDVKAPVGHAVLGGLALYGGSVLLSIVILILSMQLWNADLRVPFSYIPDGHDAFFNMMLVKTEIDTGWTAHNPLLGAPGALNQLDFLNPQFLQDSAIYLLSRFSHDFGLVINLYFLLTFPLLALTTTLAARQIGLGTATSILVGWVEWRSFVRPKPANHRAAHTPAAGRPAA